MFKQIAKGWFPSLENQLLLLLKSLIKHFFNKCKVNFTLNGLYGMLLM